MADRKKRPAQKKKKVEQKRAEELPTIKTMDEFRKVYFPKPTSERMPDEMTPQQVGERLAEESLSKVRALLEL